MFFFLLAVITCYKWFGVLGWLIAGIYIFAIKPDKNEAMQCIGEHERFKEI